MSSGVRRVARSEHVSVFGLGSLAMVLPRGQPDIDAIEQLEASLRAFAAEKDGGIALLIIIPSDARPPAGPARERARAMFAGFTDYVRIFATVIEGDGFLSAAKRSVFTFVSSILRGSIPGKVFADEDGALDWIQLRAQGDARLAIPTAGRLRRALTQARGEAGAA